MITEFMSYLSVHYIFKHITQGEIFMINKEVKTKIKAFSSKFPNTVSKLREEEELRSSLHFIDETDLDFDVINFFYHGILNIIIRDAKERAEHFNFDEGYSRGVLYLGAYVGWHALISKELQLALHTSKAYDVVTDKLIKACWTGHDQGRKKRRKH